MSSNSIKIPPYHYLHVLDRNTNVTRLEVGPQTFIKQDHETIQSKDPIKMIILPPNHYCQVTNPVIRDKDGKLIFDKHGQVSVQFGEIEYRLPGEGNPNVYDSYRQPFPLYPKESLTIAPTRCTVVKERYALKLEAIRDFEDAEAGISVNAGDEYLLKGPITYQPKIYEKVVQEVVPQIIQKQEALQLKAKQGFVDRFDIERQMGEQYLVREVGYYLPDVNEEVVKIVKPYILSEFKALQLRATKNFKDIYGVERKAGEEWLVTNQNSSYHILDIYEEFIKIQELTVLTKDQYCIVQNPIDPSTGKNKLGARQLRVGETSFFLQPGEELENQKINDVYLLQEDEALLLRAQEAFAKQLIQEYDESGKLVEKVKDLEPGDRWMLYGPGRYVPPVEVEVLQTRSKILLDKNEGIYVRDNKSGALRAVIGESYMLKAHEDLFEMEIGETVEKLIQSSLIYDSKGKRIKYRLISYKVAYNCAVQVYNYKTKESRIVFGPSLVMLQPDEQFTVTTLSGKTPKQQGMIKTLQIQLGPDFSTDIVKVETSDHAPLQITLSYNWQFRVKQGDKASELSIFNVKDFIGDMCNSMASKIRSAVASVDFDSFHKQSAQIIRKTIFGVNEKGKINDEFHFAKNNLVVTNVDIQNVEPIDPKTRESLQKTVTMAIDITTSRQQAQARHLSNQKAQEARGELMKLQIDDQSEAESLKRELLKLQAEAQSVINQGDAKAQALAQAEADEIEAQSKVELARMRAEAVKIIKQAELDNQIKKQSLSISHEKEMTDLEIKKQKELAEIESKKFESMVEAIGQQTLIAMAKSGPEQQAELLQGLGLQGYIVTDGTNPINLFNTAQGMIGNGLN